MARAQADPATFVPATGGTADRPAATWSQL